MDTTTQTEQKSRSQLQIERRRKHALARENARKAYQELQMKRRLAVAARQESIRRSRIAADQASKSAADQAREAQEANDALAASDLATKNENTAEDSLILEQNKVTDAEKAEVEVHESILQQHGVSVVGSFFSENQVCVHEITFDEPYQTIPRVMVTPQGSGDYNDTFCMSVRSVSKTGAVINIIRLDQNSEGNRNLGWGQSLECNWIAWVL